MTAPNQDLKIRSRLSAPLSGVAGAIDSGRPEDTPPPVIAERRPCAVAAIEVFLATGPEDPGEVKDRPGSADQPLQRNRILQRSLDELGVDPRNPTRVFEKPNQDADGDQPRTGCRPGVIRRIRSLP